MCGRCSRKALRCCSCWNACTRTDDVSHSPFLYLHLTSEKVITTRCTAAAHVGCLEFTCWAVSHMWRCLWFGHQAQIIFWKDGVHSCIPTERPAVWDPEWFAHTDAFTGCILKMERVEVMARDSKVLCYSLDILSIWTINWSVWQSVGTFLECWHEPLSSSPELSEAADKLYMMWVLNPLVLSDWFKQGTLFLCCMT